LSPDLFLVTEYRDRQGLNLFVWAVVQRGAFRLGIV
jgi:hypothetical protein